MYANRLQNRNMSIPKIIDKVSKHPCGICGNAAKAVASFEPDQAERLECPPGHAVFFPICRLCLAGGFDLSFLEETFIAAGIKIK